MSKPTPTSLRVTSKVAFAAVIGTILDYYDLFIFSVAAATVFSTLFFPQSDPAAAFALSLATIGIIYFTRPVGAAIFGHFGDKLGRRTTLMYALVLMGVGMLGIGLAPTYAQAGLIGAVLVSFFRLIQGIGLGGEYGNAVTLVIEHVEKRRSLWTSLIWAGVSIGATTASLLFTLAVVLSGGANTPTFVNYGWRALFLFGAAVVVVAGAIRYMISESPVFQAIKQKGVVEQLPAFMVLKEQLSRILSFAVIGVFTIPGVILIPFITAYGVTIGIPVALVTLAATVGGFVGICTCIVGGHLGDVVGRKNVVLIAAIVSLLMTYPVFLLLGTKSLPFIILAFAIEQGATNFAGGSIGALMSETFPTRRRASGVGLSYNFMTLICAIVAAVVFAPIIAAYGVASSIQYILAVYGIFCFVAILLLLLIKETKGSQLIE